MLFNSLHFLVFFPLVVFFYFLLPLKYRWLLLLVASCYFYMAFVPRYILILAFVIVVDYIVGIYLEKTHGKQKKFLLTISIISNIGILFVFKYFNFFNHNISQLAQFLGWSYSLHSLEFLLPIGLSFHTFQSLSYIIEVYRGNQKAERNFLVYAVYVMFFPQLVAGPIERPQNLLHQFYEKHFFDIQRIASGLRQMSWGFAKKILLADNLGIISDRIFNSAHQFEGIPLLIGSVCFALQLYFDFSGYSEIAIGSARVLGIDLMINFRRPFGSQSISEFWKRWHISLSTWFKDYVYIPLGGSRVSTLKRIRNLMTIFLLSGLWHGANWTYVVWGALNGLFLSISFLTDNIRLKFREWIGIEKIPFLKKIWQVGFTFTLTTVAFVFFRSSSLTDGWYIATHMWKISWRDLNFTTLAQKTGVDLFQFIFFGSLVIIFLFLEWWMENNEIDQKMNTKPVWMRYSLYAALLLLIIFFGYFEEQPFIYFQF